MQLVFDRKLLHVLSNRMWSILSSFRRRPKETFTLGSLSRRFSFWKPCELIIISNWLQAQRTTCSEQITYLTKLFPRKITLDNLCFVNKNRHWAEYQNITLMELSFQNEFQTKRKLQLASSETIIHGHVDNMIILNIWVTIVSK